MIVIVTGMYLKPIIIEMLAKLLHVQYTSISKLNAYVHSLLRDLNMHYNWTVVHYCELEAVFERLLGGTARNKNQFSKAVAGPGRTHDSGKLKYCTWFT
jgi:hypothetical protein